MKGIYIFLADGFEDIEALATNDILRRAALRCELIGVQEEPFVSSSHKVTISVDDCLPFWQTQTIAVRRKRCSHLSGGMPGSKAWRE